VQDVKISAIVGEQNGRRFMRWKLFIVGASLAVLLSGCVSTQQLEQLSAEQFGEMRASIPLSENASDRAYVVCLANAITAELPEPYVSYDWDVELFADEAVNAFAMPGGKIGVYDGIFSAATNPNQLAAVMGHEVAHVTLNHSLDRANREMATRGGVAIGAQIFGVSQTVADAVSLGADLGLLKPYGRGQESESDLVGLKYMASAGFDPSEAVPLWENMASSGGEAPPEWMSTHPSSETRIENLAAAMPEASGIYNQARAAGKRPNCKR
jgi:predicted Zn-dependent protease